MHTRRLTIGPLIIGSIAAVIILMSVLGTNATRSQQVAPCPTDWYLSTTPEVLDRCGRAKEATDVSANRTALALVPLHPTYPPPPTVVGSPSPGPPIPASAQDIRAIDLNTLYSVPAGLRGANSAWQIGSVQASDPDDYDTIYLLARPPASGVNATLAIALFGSASGSALRQVYQNTWISPQDVGFLTITNISGVTTNPTGLTGIVTFTTQSGKTGTFNLATNAWTFSP